MGELVDVTRDGGIARVVMQRKGNNSIAEDLMQELATVFQELGADPAVRVVVLASAYEKYFSVGADLTSLAGVDRDAPDPQRQSAPARTPATVNPPQPSSSPTVRKHAPTRAAPTPP